MLRVKRFVVFAVTVVIASAALSFWVIPQTGQESREALVPPPLASARSASGAGGITTAVNVTRNPDAEWLIEASGHTGIPERALRAYVAAVTAAHDSSPQCGIGWNTLAAIGSVESDHGRHGGGSLNVAGQATGQVVGPSLDGAGFAAIKDTDRGVLDGDAEWDHAVGPMQFIPSTWDYAGRDGNGDGVADPFNIDDAALSAAGYLCARGGDLTTSRGWTAAIYAYNQSDAYLQEVRQRAVRYARETGTGG
ncbi:lytic transglycosylase domain-containing protein [Pseudarthrobacter enclensis]|uniref:lytic transglycosylase domain-containing protein n=1 Tax=Pseudarthrobacter enclensis TaxID=993070 RepID=UPI0036AE4A2E